MFLQIYVCSYTYVDYVQDLFEPVRFKRDRADIEEATYMQFTRLLNEAEGM